MTQNETRVKTSKLALAIVQGAYDERAIMHDSTDRVMKFEVPPRTHVTNERIVGLLEGVPGVERVTLTGGQLEIFYEQPTAAVTNPMQLAVREFLVKHLGADDNGWPNKTGVPNKWLLIEEEIDELYSALKLYRNLGYGFQEGLMQEGDVDNAQVVKEICDVLYVVFNLCEELRIDIQPFFDAVHASNMTKTPAALSPTKKILKGPNYVPPNIAEKLAQYRSDQENGLVM